MPLVTKVLGAAPGIQYQGFIDQSETPQAASGVVGLVVGTFKRGRVDKPFIVTQESIRARLGYQPENPSYQAVQDALDIGAPVVWVQRVALPTESGED